MTELNDTVDILSLHRRAEDHERYGRIGAIAAGAVLAGAAVLSGRSPVRWMLGLSGGLLLTRGFTGLGVRQLLGKVESLFAGRRDLERRFHDGEHDIVDAASFDSFPASDPPSYSPGIG